MIPGMGRTRVRGGRVTVLVVGFGVAAALTGPLSRAGAPRDAEQVARRSYVVREGDTLWSIASRIVGESADPRPLVFEIASSNGVDPGRLVPGQTLIIPSDA